ncbi:MAG: hypothetical protein ACRC41_01510 [Sarcina sp.]
MLIKTFQGELNPPNTVFINEMKPYVIIKDSQYIIDSKIYQNKNITTKDINELQDLLNVANQIATKSHTQNQLNLEHGTVVLGQQSHTDDFNNFQQIVGVTKIVYFWWGCYIYLNNVDTQWLAGLTTIAAAAALSVLFPGIGGVIAAAIAGLIGLWGGIESPLTANGCVISYNYATGPQQSWAQ